MNLVTIEQIKKKINDHFAFKEYFENNLTKKLTTIQLEKERVKIGEEFRKIVSEKSHITFDGKVENVIFIGQSDGINRWGIVIDIGIPNTHVWFYPEISKEKLEKINIGDIIKIDGEITYFTHQENDGYISLIIDSNPPRKYQEKKSNCFIATACYGNFDATEVLVLRQFRDDKLLETFLGKMFVKFYYSASPFFAKLISKSDLLKKLVRQYFLEPIVTRLQRRNKL